MARIVDLALEASDIHRSYSAVHEELLGASVRRWASIAGLRKPVDFPGLANRLTDLESELAGIRAELAGLPAEELTKRAKDDLRDALDLYAKALARAIDKLRVICGRMGKAEETGAGQAVSCRAIEDPERRRRGQDWRPGMRVKTASIATQAGAAGPKIVFLSAALIRTPGLTS